MERLARDNALEILASLVRAGADIYERDNTGASLTRAASVDRFSPVIRFLVEAGCRVTENVINWVKVRNPESQALCEQSVKMPNSLLVQSRAVIWRLLREASITSQMKYGERIEKLVQSEELPLIMSDYLQCKI